jgi:hypothetical protein
MGWRSHGALTLLLVLGGCESDTDLRGEIVLGPEVMLEGIPGAVTTIGYLDGWVLVTSTLPVASPPAD